MKAFSLLEGITDLKEVGVTELAIKTKTNKTTVYRLLSTFEKLGYLRKTENQKYFLTLKLFELGTKVLENISIVEIAKPILKKMSDITNETIHLAALDNDEVVYLDKFDSTHTLRMYSRIGRRVPTYCTALGKVFLAWGPESLIKRVAKDLRPYTKNTITDLSQLKEQLSKIRKEGYAIDNEEYEYGVKCIAAPIRNVNGEVVAAISISGPSVRLTAEKIQELKPIILDYSNKISSKIVF